MIPIKDKKGLVGISLFTIGLIIAVVMTIILGLAFLFSNSLKFYIIGTIIIVISIIYGLRAPKFDKSRTLFLIISFLTGVVFILIPSFGLIQTAYSPTFTPVYCNDYSFTCCVENIVPFTATVTTTTGVQCSSNANYCKLIAYSDNNYYADYLLYAGKTDCKSSYNPLIQLIGNSFSCSDGRLMSVNEIFQKGEYIYFRGGGGTITFNTAYNKLIFTGRAGSTVGVSVLGADGCSFNPSATYKDGKLVTFDPKATSYPSRTGECVLTFVPGDRHICGNLEEQCKLDSDCGGHTYGNKECIGRTLQTYGCTKLALPSYLETYSGGYAYKPFSGDNDGSESTLSRCEIKSSVQVQCCGDTDCGSNAFCDKTTFTCKASGEIPCTADYQCATSQQCDSVNKQLKTPKCSSGKCAFDTRSIGCCITSDCANGYFCGTDYQCKQSINPCTECIGECCISECTASGGYFDKPCADGLFCVNNICKSDGCKSDSDCDIGQICKNGNCIDEPDDPKDCSWYQEYLIKEEQKYSWYNYIGIGKPQITTTSGCYTSNLVYIVIIGLIIGSIIITSIILLNPRKTIRRKKSR